MNRTSKDYDMFHELLLVSFGALLQEGRQESKNGLDEASSKYILDNILS